MGVGNWVGAQNRIKTMKFNARPINDTEFAVFKNKTQYFSATVSTDLEAVKQDAAARSALWHVQQAANLVVGLSLDSAIEIGHAARNDIIDLITEKSTADKLEQHVAEGGDPDDFMDFDSTGWLA
jgi:hypothetical protein